MKKFLAIFILAVLAALFFMHPAVAADGTVTQSLTYARNGETVTGISEGIAAPTELYVLTLTCVGSSSDGSIPDTALTMDFIKGLYLYSVTAYPTSGGTAPDAADVFILDAGGEDYLGSADGGTTAGTAGANLIHATLKKTTMPYSYFNSSYFFFPVISTLTLRVANQATHSADYTIVLVFGR